MNAAYLTETGKPDVIRYGPLPSPEPRPGEVRVRVMAASVNPIDTYLRSGMVAANLPMPFIPGCDFAGIVDGIGEGVTRFKAGDRVWGSNQGLLGRQGTFAEYCCPAEEWTYSLPRSVSFRDAAAVALVGITSHLGLFRAAQLRPGETVFVNGGTGGVGAMVVQMAKAVGANVVTTVGSSEKVVLAKSLGADVALNYKSDDLAAGIKAATAGKGIDVWYETQPPTDLDTTVATMAPGGRVVVMAGRNARPVFPNGPFYVKGLSLHGFAMFNVPPAEQRVAAEEINRWFTDGKLKASIGKVFPLAEAAAAHALQEENTLGKAGTLTGKIVIDVTTE
jgi:NADPH2:quinone reductase